MEADSAAGVPAKKPTLKMSENEAPAHLGAQRITQGSLLEMIATAAILRLVLRVLPVAA